MGRLEVTEAASALSSWPTSRDASPERWAPPHCCWTLLFKLKLMSCWFRQTLLMPRYLKKLHRVFERLTPCLYLQGSPVKNSLARADDMRRHSRLDKPPNQTRSHLRLLTLCLTSCLFPCLSQKHGRQRLAVSHLPQSGKTLGRPAEIL